MASIGLKNQRFSAKQHFRFTPWLAEGERPHFVISHGSRLVAPNRKMNFQLPSLIFPNEQSVAHLGCGGQCPVPLFTGAFFAYLRWELIAPPRFRLARVVLIRSYGIPGWTLRIGGAPSKMHRNQQVGGANANRFGGGNYQLNPGYVRRGCAPTDANPGRASGCQLDPPRVWLAPPRVANPKRCVGGVC